MKILVTGFEPFSGEKINPSFEAVKKLPNYIGNAQIIKASIPTIFRKSIEVLDELIVKEKPEIVICVGQAGGRYEITVERVAINIDDANIPDNEGNNPKDKVIFEDGENAYFSNLPIKKMVEEIKNCNIPASISNSAGTFVCNHLMYGLLYLINKKYKNMKGGFIHVPYLPQQVLNKKNVPSMSLDNIVQALVCSIKAILKEYNDE
ncbi:pcp pyrrolidone-carboxylate peptidase [Thermosipho africanus H17ap60334]|jgi:pyroglutamyl-peptidase|uniref:pyroglutamyl-peptidase I n=1 Tax=Thermosipho TaxID=2420 RepID=UPI00028EFDA1|nr:MULTISPECIES: pyroglutamyl-peptidase I [Thermosipho]EKF49157.1 pcp pyrrolidone-carboxylate peptidase [Thermosipho africanus H17ap60334]MBZ4649611.1 pcp pyrrolidone-carboxylate peptidase [Thermosipho sp. (in: thermotogales)]MDK2839969.1 pyroglutamyl-peptidase [Thermosipho sp. (in: thermotogales)]